MLISVKIVFIFLFATTCSAKSLSSPVIFEPLFFKVMPGIEVLHSFKGRTRDIPILMPQGSAPNIDHSKRVGIHFSNSSQNENTVDNIRATSKPHQANNFGPNPGGEFTIGFTTNPPSIPIEPHCTANQSLIMYNGKCRRLLSSHSCERPKHWLVVSHSGEPKCVKRQCPVGQVYYIRWCFNITDSSLCGENEIFYLEHTGRAYCDCQPFFVFDPRSDKCIEEHQRGSCPVGMYLESTRSSAGSTVACKPNPCFPYYNKTKNFANGQCYTKKYIGACPKNELKFNDRSNEVECFNVHTRNIFEVPALTSCPPGSRRDYLGRCQRVVRFGSTSPLSYRVPSIHTSRYSVCPTGFTKYPNGTCRKIKDVLG